MESRRPKPVIVHALMGALLFQALGAVGGGLALVADPTGASMGMSVGAAIVVLTVLAPANP